MRTRFDVAVDDDDRAFAGARLSLLDGFEAWLTERGEADATGVRDDAAVFVDWRYGFSTGELANLAGAVDHFVHYLAATDRLEGGSASADELASSAAGLVPKAKRALANPDRHGMTKTTLMVVRDTARLVDGITSDELPSLDDLVAQFGAAQRALPAEVEAATTDEKLYDIADVSTEGPVHAAARRGRRRRRGTGGVATAYVRAIRCGPPRASTAARHWRRGDRISTTTATSDPSSTS